MNDPRAKILDELFEHASQMAAQERKSRYAPKQPTREPEPTQELASEPELDAAALEQLLGSGE